MTKKSAKTNELKNNKLSQPKKVLVVLSTLNKIGGVPNRVMDIYRIIDKRIIQFDFFVYSDVEDSFESEILSLGGHVYYFGRIKEIGSLKFYTEFINLLKKNNYYAIHSYNGIYDSPLILLSKLFRVKVRVSHSRGAGLDNRKVKILFPILRFILTLSSTNLLACSEVAGRFLFKNKSFKVIPNPINAARFIEINESNVSTLRNEFSISDSSIILGHIGRFSPEKNHKYLIEIAAILDNIGLNYKIILVGSGPLEDEIRSMVKGLKLSNKIIFAGNRTNIQDFYHLFDILLFPSFHEGFGNVAVEGQAARTPVIASNGVSREVDLGLGLIDFIDLESIDCWIEKIKHIDSNQINLDNTSVEKAMHEKGFTIDNIIKDYYDLYKVNMKEIER